MAEPPRLLAELQDASGEPIGSDYVRLPVVLNGTPIVTLRRRVPAFTTNHRDAC